MIFNQIVFISQYNRVGFGNYWSHSVPFYRRGRKLIYKRSWQSCLGWVRALYLFKYYWLRLLARWCGWRICTNFVTFNYCSRFGDWIFFCADTHDTFSEGKDTWWIALSWARRTLGDFRISNFNVCRLGDSRTWGYNRFNWTCLHLSLLRFFKKSKTYP